VRLYDAHNHLQDQRLRPHLSAIMAAVQAEPIARMVVNGASELDWPDVLELARQYPQVLPSFGYHPWHLKQRAPQWQAELTRFLDAVPSAVGEIGLDRWIKDRDEAAQQEAFVWQFRLAVERGLPVSIHCLQAWGPLLEIIRREPRPPGGFLLHSYGGAPELIPSLAKLGAYFSLLFPAGLFCPRAQGSPARDLPARPAGSPAHRDGRSGSAAARRTQPFYFA
jgi:TatD DNase family protein